ncbi:hypothetical protein GRAN_1330 [Granulicella sibirica]|uniref:Uncharacterized protein n=1 Tax=Granulicella sibirica TaxID=2479048 RepID=A0A4Q0T5X0_9BACT|nr:hypothetical protein GRAN_1330 [Granulicella sibirica]
MTYVHPIHHCPPTCRSFRDTKNHPRRVSCPAERNLPVSGNVRRLRRIRFGSLCLQTRGKAAQHSRNQQNHTHTRPYTQKRLLHKPILTSILLLDAGPCEFGQRGGRTPYLPAL